MITNYLPKQTFLSRLPWLHMNYRYDSRGILIFANLHVYYVLHTQFSEAWRFKLNVMFLPDSLHMTSLIKPWSDINVFVGFKSVSQDWTCINLFRGACTCWICRIIVFFRLIGLNETINFDRQFLWLKQHSSGFSFKQVPKKGQAMITPSNPEIHVTYIYICPLLLPSPNLFGSYSLSGIIKIPYSRFGFLGWTSCFGWGHAQRPFPTHFDGVFSTASKVEEVWYLYEIHSGPSNHTQSMYMYIIISI